MGDVARVWVVDRLAGDRAVLVADDTGERTEIARGALHRSVREGDVLRVPRGTDGTPDWALAHADDALRSQRMQEAQGVLDRLKKRDPGGNVKL